MGQSYGAAVAARFFLPGRKPEERDMFMKSCCVVAAFAAVSVLGASAALGKIAIPTVRIGNPGNAADPTTGFGSVAYSYNIGSTEVTNAQ